MTVKSFKEEIKDSIVTASQDVEGMYGRVRIESLPLYPELGINGLYYYSFHDSPKQRKQ
jgi:hypothetical protein